MKWAYHQPLEMPPPFFIPARCARVTLTTAFDVNSFIDNFRTISNSELAHRISIFDGQCLRDFFLLSFKVFEFVVWCVIRDVLMVKSKFFFYFDNCDVMPCNALRIKCCFNFCDYYTIDLRTLAFYTDTFKTSSNYVIVYNEYLSLN